MAVRGADRVRCSGSIYVTVLACSMLLTVVGLGSLLAVRVQRRSTQAVQDQSKARLYAQSAIELGLLSVAQDDDWRTTQSNGTWLSEVPLDDGTLTLEGIDPADGELSDSQYDTLVLTGTGARGSARHKARVMLVPVIDPLEALDTCVHAGTQVRVTRNKSLTVVGAPVSTNGVVNNTGTIDGDVETVALGTTGTITGTVTTAMPVRAMPSSEAISYYIAKATVIPFTGDIDGQVLTATSNPWGAADPNGYYYINAENEDFQISNCRIQATLIIYTKNGNVSLTGTVLMQPHRSDSPVLIVDGNVLMNLTSEDATLSESQCGVNFNPAGSPYQGQTDEDQDDEYPNLVQGLVYITGDLGLGQTTRIEGGVICGDEVTCGGDATIVHDDSLYATPPQGYTYVSGMKISPGSYRQVVD